MISLYILHLILFVSLAQGWLSAACTLAIPPKAWNLYGQKSSHLSGNLNPKTALFWQSGNGQLGSQGLQVTDSSAVSVFFSEHVSWKHTLRLWVQKKDGRPAHVYAAWSQSRANGMRLFIFTFKCHLDLQQSKKHNNCVCLTVHQVSIWI